MYPSYMKLHAYPFIDSQGRPGKTIDKTPYEMWDRKNYRNLCLDANATTLPPGLGARTYTFA